MVEITINSQIQQMQAGYVLGAEKIKAAEWAEKLFDKSYKAAMWARMWSWFRPNSATLLYLHPNSLFQKKGATSLQLVPLAQIKGSCSGRLHDFDASLRPLRQHNKARWLSVAMAYYMHKPLPPVELVKVDDVYFVLDGHHRLSVAGSMGIEAIEANVTEWHLAKPARSSNSDHPEENVSTNHDSQMMPQGRKVSVGPPLAAQFAAQAAGVRPCIGSYRLWGIELPQLPDQETNSA